MNLYRTTGPLVLHVFFFFLLFCFLFYFGQRFLQNYSTLSVVSNLVNLLSKFCCLSLVWASINVIVLR